VALLALAGCALTVAPDSANGTRDMLATRLNDARRAQQAALTLWDRIIFGEQVSCQEAIPTPELLALPENGLRAHPDAQAIQDELNAAIQTIHNSSDLWNIECASENPYVSLSMARAGRANALAATESLDAAAALLAAWR
jgi:hypothetical protein